MIKVFRNFRTKSLTFFYYYYYYLQFQVINYERDINKAKKGETEDLIYQKIAGFNEDFTGTVDKPQILQDEDVSCSGSGSSDDEDEDDGESMEIIIYQILL